MLSAEEAIEKFKKFERRANTKRSKQIDRIKEDRKFLSGTQWDNDDDAIYPASRPRRTVNILGNSVNSTVNVYAAYPYNWYSPDDEADQACTAFLKAGSNSRAAYDVLYSTVAFGLGYFAIGSEDVIASDGEVVPVPALYSIDKVENVYFDPDSVEIDGRDACEAFICEFRSKEWVMSKYGEEYVSPKDVAPVVNVTANSDKNQMVIVTYFRMENGKCQVYRLLNNQFLDDPVELNLDRIPVFPVYGERSWDDNDDIVWQGIVRKGAPIQKLLNYSWSQLGERMAMSPKPTFITHGEAVENLDSGYRNFQYNGNPLLLYNRTSADGKVVFEPPQRIDNRVQFDDLTGVIGAQLDLLTTITGVDAKGVMDGDTPQVTATEVLYNERNAQTSIRHFYANLKDSYRAVGSAILQLLNLGKRRVDVVAGPSEYMELQIARAELMQLMSQVPEDKRMQFVNGIFLSHPENSILRNVFGAINTNPGPSALEQEAMQTVETMKEAIGQKDQQIAELQEQIKNLEQYQNNNDKNLQADFLKLKLQHEYGMEDKILQAQLDSGLDADKAATEVQKSEIDLQNKLVQLDTAKLKANTEKVKAATDIAKTMMSMQQPEQKNDEVK